MDGYSAQDVVRMLGLSPGRLRVYVRAGFLSPERAAGGRLRFSFRDLLLLRTAEGLVAERIPPRRVLRALKKLRQRLPETRPLTGLQLAADGDQVVVRDGPSRWHPESGQVLLAFPDGSAPAADTPVSAFPSRQAAAPPPIDRAPVSETPAGPARADLSVDDLLQIGGSLEETDPSAAEQAYRRLLALDAAHADGHINLGRLLHETGRFAEAEAHYRLALELRPGDATATFNLGVAIEDQGRIDEALAQYERAVALDCRNPDAHYNAARLYEKAGKYTAAIRHLRAYKELTR